MAQYTGIVALFDSAKGYGFLTAEDVKDVFFHYSAIQDIRYSSLREGASVEFNLIDGEEGLQADQVVVLS